MVIANISGGFCFCVFSRILPIEGTEINIPYQSNAYTKTEDNQLLIALQETR